MTPRGAPRYPEMLENFHDRIIELVNAIEAEDSKALPYHAHLVFLFAPLLPWNWLAIGQSRLNVLESGLVWQLREVFGEDYRSLLECAAGFDKIKELPPSIRKRAEWIRDALSDERQKTRD